MRILLVFIILLNVLYVGWEMLNPVKLHGEVEPMHNNLKTLVLLNEDAITRLKNAPKDVEEKGEGNNEQSEKTGVDDLIDGSTQDAHSNDMLSGNNQSEDVKTCYTLGPFKDKNIMQQLRESIAEYVTDLSVRKRQQTVKHRYWVFVPAQENKKQAKLMGKRLREKQLNDFYIVLSGEQKNSISLGHYREPSHANRRVKKVIKLGFNAQIKVIYREYDIFWLDYQVDMQGEGAGFSVDEYVSDGISQLKRDCAL